MALVPGNPAARNAGAAGVAVGNLAVARTEKDWACGVAADSMAAVEAVTTRAVAAVDAAAADAVVVAAVVEAVEAGTRTPRRRTPGPLSHHDSRCRFARLDDHVDHLALHPVPLALHGQCLPALLFALDRRGFLPSSLSASVPPPALWRRSRAEGHLASRDPSVSWIPSPWPLPIVPEDVGTTTK